MINGHHHSYIQAAIEGEVARLASAETGERNTTLFSASAKLASLGCREGEILRHLRPAAELIGLRGGELYNTVKSGVKAGYASPRTNVPQRDGIVSISPESRSKGSEQAPPRQPGSDAGERTPPTYSVAGNEGPPVSGDEERRHVYNLDGIPVRVKIKRSGGYVNWYRLAGNRWQPKKPDGYIACPFTGVFDAFDSEFRTECLYWPEGEKDCDTLSREGLAAFTFGGTGDGLPPDIDRYLQGRDIVILADNDVGGRKHATKKAQRAHLASAASVRIVEFPELPEKADVSDFLKTRSVGDLEERAKQAKIWVPSDTAFEPASSARRELVMCNLSDVEPERIDWLWPGRLAVGKLTIVAGEPGLGKSQLAIYIASCITLGAEWVCSGGRAPRGRVLMLSAEDGLADTVRPRFDAAGGDPAMVSVIRATQCAGPDGVSRGTFNLAADLSLLEAEISRLGDVVLVIIDPLSSYMLNVDSHKNTDVRSILEPVSEMGERLRVAILATSHLSKGEGKAINRIIGSIAFVAAARAVFTVVADPEDETRRLLLSVKNNIASAQQGLAFRLEQREIAPGILGSAVMWDETASVSLTADQVLAGAGSHASTKTDAVEFLRDILSNGPVPVREIELQAVEASLLADGKPIGQSKPFRTAREELGVKPQRSGGLGSQGRWVWALPDAKVPPARYDAPVSDGGIIGSEGHLRNGEDAR
jgi:putative DNA primase/helicase